MSTEHKSTDPALFVEEFFDDKLMRDPEMVHDLYHKYKDILSVALRVNLTDMPLQDDGKNGRRTDYMSEILRAAVPIIGSTLDPNRIIGVLDKLRDFMEKEREKNNKGAKQ